MHLSRLGLLVLALRTWWCGLSAYFTGSMRVAPNARSLSIGCEGCSSPWVRLTYLDAWLVSFSACHLFLSNLFGVE